MTEAELQKAVIELAQTFKWRVYHTHDSRRSQAGFPDLCMVREAIIFAELKSEKGKIRPEQQEWIDALWNASGTSTEVYVWRPADWLSGAIEMALR